MKLTPTLTNRNIPDSYGTNAYLSDPDFASLLGIYLDHEVMSFSSNPVSSNLADSSAASSSNLR